MSENQNLDQLDPIKTDLMEIKKYCSECAPLGEPDIDLLRIAVSLGKGEAKAFICEGCNLRVVIKDMDGMLFLARLEDEVLILYPTTLDDLPL